MTGQEDGQLQLSPNPPEVELVYISIANMGHILPAVEISRRLIARSSNRISVTIILIKFLVNNYTVDSYIESFKSQQSNPNLSLVEVSPPPDNLPDGSGVTRYVDSCREVIRQTLHDRYPQQQQQQGTQQPRLAGLVVDLFCSNLTNLSEDLGVPSYMFFTSGANLLSFMLHFESLGIDVPAVYGGRSPDETVVEISGFENPIPLKVWPPIILAEDKRDRGAFLKLATQFRRTKGILVNTFHELESSIIQSLASTTTTRPRGDVDVNAVVPPVYPVGPVLNLREDPTNRTDKNRSILNWLDLQPHGSVVFLCFGGRGSFYEDQVREIATGLERTGQRFVWSLRRRPDSSRESNDDVGGSTSTNTVKLLGLPGEYGEDDLNSVLPDGFLDRTSGVGRVIGWAPQVAVLAHKAVGAFVSHCGWNSITESLWFGVPIVAWPMFGEQQLNAFSLLREMGLAVELRMDYQCNFREYDKPNMLVTAEEVETGIRRIMMNTQGEEGDRVRKKVKEISQLGKKAVLDPDHGSSNQTMDRFIQDVLRSINYRNPR